MSLLKLLKFGKGPTAQPVVEQKPAQALPPVANTLHKGSYEAASEFLRQIVPDLEKVGGTAYRVLPIIPGHNTPHAGTLNRIKLEDNDYGFIEGVVRATDEGRVAFMIEFRLGASPVIRTGLQYLVDWYESNNS